MRTITLPTPADGARACSFHEALERHRSTREIAARALTLLQRSNLLWAAFGVNRREGPFGGPGRRAASASNSQEIDVYVALESGIYL